MSALSRRTLTKGNDDKPVRRQPSEGNVSDRSRTAALADEEISIAPLARDQITEAASVLAGSFLDDPNHRHLFPEEKTRARILPHEFSAVCRALVDSGHIYAASQNGTIGGIAIWVPPDEFPFSLRRQVRTLPYILRILTISPRSIKRVMQLATSIEESHPEQPYWYLLAVGVEPSMQGQGIGTRLLKPILERADEAGERCFLETASKQNVAWYRGLGFEISESEIPFIPNGPPNWTLLREPDVL